MWGMQDWSASEFTALVGTLRDQCLHHDDLAAQSSHLLRHLDLLWEEQYAHCCTARVGITENGMLNTFCAPPASHFIREGTRGSKGHCIETLKVQC